MNNCGLDVGSISKELMLVIVFDTTEREHVMIIFIVAFVGLGPQQPLVNRTVKEYVPTAADSSALSCIHHECESFLSSEYVNPLGS